MGWRVSGAAHWWGRLLAGVAAWSGLTAGPCCTIATARTGTANGHPVSPSNHLTANPPPPRGRVTVWIDTQESRLFVFSDGILYTVFPVALGKPETPSPVGEWLVVDKQKDWGSGFGTRWIGLNVPWGTYGIHGTNRPESIGTRASSGCIRMFNRDVETLYEWVRVGTPVVVEGDPLAGMRRLAAGDVGADVRVVQDRLWRFGYFNGPRNGRFGTRTDKAMRAFEADHGLQVDGVVGLADYRALGLFE
ncbi:MAG: L,D-transpeptidase family protein [Alicyclobacillaceae bacterium]|nr:L,D-transpeptidase family protein [Alicyclobacillaceae bacterium]